jgi:8-oxo-dGTP pyrophosphatase MutT (NUDIX family)
MIEAYGIALFKKVKNSYQILLCKSVVSNDRWGLLKGVKEEFESQQDCAIREFFEESGILIQKQYLTKYFDQQNEDKYIGVWLVNYNHIDNIDKYFKNNRLEDKYLSSENSDVCFFDIQDLPLIKKRT